jgi:lipid II:glycine glycyltransferase (peptidoglycan interpeptide bridge formation enzyme)
VILHSSKNINYGFVYFDEEYTKSRKIDIIRENQFSKKRFTSTEFYTLIINLSLDEEIIFSKFEKGTQYKINRAKNRDGMYIETLNAKIDKELFYDFYNNFAHTKKLSSLLIPEIDSLIDNNVFAIRATLYNSKMIVFHTYITSNNRARLVHSASLFREIEDTSYTNIIGRANRLLHWDDILYFKHRGYKVYDFGGISMDQSDVEKQNINKFKKSFGGTLVKEYNSLVPVSLKGYLYVLYRMIKKC